MRFISIIILLWFLTYSLFTTLSNTDFPNENKIKKNIEYLTIQKNITEIEKEKITEKLKLALHFISEKKSLEIKIQEYKDIIDNFYSIIQQLYDEKDNTPILQNNNNTIPSINKLQQHQLQINQQLIKLNQELQQAQDLSHTINNSLILLPEQHIKTKKELNNIKQKISFLTTKKNISQLELAELTALQAEKEAKQLKIEELELEQLSANNRQEISRLNITLLKKKYEQLDKKAQILHIQLHNIRKQETQQTIKNIETLFENQKKNTFFPKIIIQQLQINRQLSQTLKKQIQHINLITMQQREITTQNLQIQQTLSKLLEQSQWIHKSPTLGEILRAQIFKLPKPNIHKLQQLDSKMTKLRKERLQYEAQIDKLSLLISLQKKNHYNDIELLTANQKKILEIQINIQNKLLNSLLKNCDIQILELTKLKISHEQLNDYLKEQKKIIQCYLFWIADLYPINLSYFYKVYQDLHLLLNINNFSQFKYTIKTITLKNIQILILLITFTVCICCTHTTYHHYYYSFLLKSKKILKKTHENYIILTLKNIFWSNIISIPIPIIWNITGYILSRTWEYPTLSALGEGMISSTPVLWIMIILSYFTSKNGLFITNFKWKKEKIHKAFHNYYLYIITIVFLITIITTFNTYHEKEFYNTLSRFFFVILCISLIFIIHNIEQANLPLHIDKHGSSNNIINYILWKLMIITPGITIITSFLGYLSTSQILLMYLGISLITLLISSIVYYTCRCWILTQKYQILSKHNQHKQKTSTTNKKILPFECYDNNTSTTITTNKNNTCYNITKNLNTISNQSLQLIQLILTLITYFIIFLFLTESQFILPFLDKLATWNTKFTIEGVSNIQSITLKTLLISSLIFFITIKTTKNIPSLLELTIFQHINLTPGSHYAITTITKYTLMILGITIGCSNIGIEWSKFQWLIAAIGVGLGFGLQEIFANFISGLIMLFEKPIRIGDTITISELTGKITQINIRATTITDRDHKEIIIPNKEFVTKKFINWSLADTITRVVLKVPGPSEADITQVIEILFEAIKNCPLVLKIPKPEIYLIDIEKGIPLFEIRIHTAKIKHRMPLRHQIHILIIHFYKKHGLQLPFPHIHIHS